MNLETTASTLRAALDAVAGVIERRSTIPVLGTVRISKDGIVATNLDTEVSVKLPTTGIRYLIDALSALTGDTVSIGAEKSQIAGAPAIITSNDDPLRIVLMPMRV